MLPFGLLFAFLFSAAFADTAATSKMHFLDAQFAKKVCEGWNQSALPDKLSKKVEKKGITPFLYSEGGAGKVDCVMHRKECKNMKPIVLKIQEDKDERAVCADADWFSGTVAEGVGHWNINPSTYKWVRWSDGFGVLSLPGILDGFKGNYGLALKHIGEFELFFAIANKVAEANSVDWECADNKMAEDEMQDVLKAVGKVDKDDRAEILKKGNWIGG